jgi:CubicO group peptidase (beta-lactamase class C family)
MKMHLITALLIGITLVCSSQKTSQIKHLDGSQISVNRLTTSIQNIVDTAMLTGLSVVIINDNKEVYKNTFGYSNKEKKSLLNATTKMYAASFTKPVFSYLFLKLIEKGVFSLDTPLVKYLKKPIGAYEKCEDLAKETSFANVTPRNDFKPQFGLTYIALIIRRYAQTYFKTWVKILLLK